MKYRLKFVLEGTKTTSTGIKCFDADNDERAGSMVPELLKQAETEANRKVTDVLNRYIVMPPVELVRIVHHEVVAMVEIPAEVFP